MQEKIKINFYARSRNPESGYGKINDLLRNKNELAGAGQEQMAGRQLRNQRLRGADKGKKADAGGARKDDRIDNPEDQRTAAAELNIRQQSAKREELKRGSEMAKSQTGRQIAERAASIETIEEAKSFGMGVAEYLAKAIEEGKFSGFLIALIVALVKDVLVEIIARFPETLVFDIPLIEALQSISDWLYWIIFFIVYFVQPGILRRWIIRKHLGKIVAFIIVSFIPYVDMLPEATATILIIKFSADRRRRKLEKELENVEREFGLERRKKRKK